MNAQIERLDRRQLLSADFPADRYSGANDTYDLTIGTAIPTTPLRSIAWGASNIISVAGTGQTSFQPSVSDFAVTLPAGPATTKLLQLQIAGTLSATAVIREVDPTGAVRASWTLSTVNITGNSFSSDTNNEHVYSTGLHFVSIATVFNQLASDGTVLSTAQATFNTVSRVTTSSPLLNSNLATTTTAVRDTIEFQHGQMPVLSYAIAASTPTGSNTTSFSDPNFTTPASLDDPSILGTMLRGIAVSNVIYTSRDAAMRPETRWRHDTVYFTSFAIADASGDGKPRVDSIAYTGRRVGVAAYTYDAGGLMQTPTTAGYNTDTNTAFDPVGGSAYVLGPSSGPRNTPRDSVEFRFSQAIAGLTLANFNFDNFVTAGLTLTPSAGNTIWTITGLAAQQSIDRHYAVKLLVLNPTFGGGLIGSAAVSWDLDRSLPTIVSKSFDPSAANPNPYRFIFSLSEPVAATGAQIPLLIRKAGTGELVATVFASIDAAGTTLTGASAAPFADGRYIATLPSGSVKDLAGNLLNTDTALPFFTLAGDANHDGTVNFDDLIVLAQNYNKMGRSFAQGNFNYDPAGTVNFDDLIILAQHYNTNVPTAILAPTTTKAAPASKRITTDVLA